MLESSRASQFLRADYPDSYSSAMQKNIRDIVQPVFSRKAATTIELLDLIAGATSAHQLNKLVNKFQSKIWSLSKDEQGLLRERLAGTLSELVLQSQAPALRLEAAAWLRLLVQAAYLAEPAAIFTTLVAAATANRSIDDAERRAYLQMLVDCFWPFRHPYAAYTWQQLPPNAAFLPLTALFELNDDAIEDTLVIVFSQLPALDEGELQAALLPVALRWAAHADAELRQRIIPLLAQLGKDAAARAALEGLGRDPVATVRANAQRAINALQSA
jgi:hypothetical protein